MIIISVNWPIFLEIGLIVLFILAIVVVSTILLVRTLRKNFKEVYKYQSKLDIELRKTMNLITKRTSNSDLKKFENAIVKDLPHEEKKALLGLVEQVYSEIDKDDPELAYVVETYERLQEIRRIRDGKAIIFNHQITMFPFNIYSRIFKIKKWDLFTHQEKDRSR